MTINSYFYDSLYGDRPYSAKDFARAFGILTKTGVIPNENTGNLGFTLSGTNYTTVSAGKASVEGRLVEVTGTETLTVPSGSYDGLVVIRVDITVEREASIVVRTDRTPQQDNDMYELPLYECKVTNGVITAVTDVREQGGAYVHDHTHTISGVTGLQSALNNKVNTSNGVTWRADPNGVVLVINDHEIFFTTSQPYAKDKRVWIQTV